MTDICSSLFPFVFKCGHINHELIVWWFRWSVFNDIVYYGTATANLIGIGIDVGIRLL